MRIRRCAHLLLEPLEQVRLDMEALVRGEVPLRAQPMLLARCAHLDEPVEIEPGDVALLQGLSPNLWRDAGDLGCDESNRVHRLLQAGVIVDESGEHGLRDARLRETPWPTLSAVAHFQTRWRGNEVSDNDAPPGARDVFDANGLPPPAHERAPDRESIPLPATALPAPLSELFERRVTCRNFDQAKQLPLAQLATVLHEVFGYRADGLAGRVARVHKRSSPSAGSLHPVQARLLVRDVEGLSAGTYAYDPEARDLQFLSPVATTDTDRLMRRFAAGQPWFADCHVQIALVARLGRTFGKYRLHPKAHRAIVLDAGHLSQTLYLVATAIGLGAFVTAAINERDIEEAFGLDPLRDGVVALTGLGPRAAAMQHPEFDPLRAIWRE